MKTNAKAILQTILAIGLVLLSLRPSLTNRVDSLSPKAGVFIARASTSVNVHSAAAFLHYRGSFEKTEKRVLAATHVWPETSSVCFFAPLYRVEASSLSIGYSSSIRFQILRI
jgi:hypothetical protein